MSEVSFINGRTRLYAIVGDPIIQVKSPEMVTWEFHRRGINALVVPMHIGTADFETCMPAIQRLHNLDGLIFTIPFKARALAFADEVGPQARRLGGFNALARRPDGRWAGEMFDGLGCAEALRRRGVAVAGRRLMVLGLGGAGTAIAAALASERPAVMWLHDLKADRIDAVAQLIASISPDTQLQIGQAPLDEVDILLNATPMGMLDDQRMAITATTLPAGLVVFDAVVIPEQTPLLRLAESCGCTVVKGREMMLGQIARIVDFFQAR